MYTVKNMIKVMVKGTTMGQNLSFQLPPLGQKVGPFYNFVWKLLERTKLISKLAENESYLTQMRYQTFN